MTLNFLSLLLWLAFYVNLLQLYDVLHILNRKSETPARQCLERFAPVEARFLGRVAR